LIQVHYLAAITTPDDGRTVPNPFGLSVEAEYEYAKIKYKYSPYNFRLLLFVAEANICFDSKGNGTVLNDILCSLPEVRYCFSVA
jgi:hypothetical protein